MRATMVGCERRVCATRGGRHEMVRDETTGRDRRVRVRAEPGPLRRLRVVRDSTTTRHGRCAVCACCMARVVCVVRVARGRCARDTTWTRSDDRWRPGRLGDDLVALGRDLVTSVVT